MSAAIPHNEVPRRLLLDTCMLNVLQDEGGYIFEGELPPHVEREEDVPEDLRAMRRIMAMNERAMFDFVVSPLSFAEIANQQEMGQIGSRLKWALDVIDVWLIALDESGERKRHGGTVCHRFKLSEDLQELESRLMRNPDFRRDPFDRLLLVQYRMAQCDAFLTTDRKTIWKHRELLAREGINVITPSEFWRALSPLAHLC